MDIIDEQHRSHERPGLGRKNRGLQSIRARKTPGLVLLMFGLSLLLAACGAPEADKTITSSDAAPVTDVIRDDAPAGDTDSLTMTPEQRGPYAVDMGYLNPNIITAHNKLGLLIHDLLVRKATSEQNVFLSPLSISLALSMVYNGAAGETAEALAHTLQFGDLDLNTINVAHRALLDAFTGAGDGQLGVQLHIANSIWHRQGFTLRPHFLRENEQFYGATASALDFSAPDSVAVINDWVSRQTEGLIDGLIDRLEEDLALLLINTVYFKGEWAIPFDPALTRDGAFHLTSGEQRMVPMMYRDGRFGHYAGPDFEAVRLPYGDNERLAMYVFLPSADSDLTAFSERLSVENWNEWLAAFTPKLGEVTLPRIDIGYKTSLNDVLQSLGMGVAFDRMRADFSNMVPADSSEKLSISDVIHQSVLKVDEEGTEAAAATSVGLRVTSMPLYDFRFTADRPFFLAIRDDATGELLFIGSIVDPS